MPVERLQVTKNFPGEDAEKGRRVAVKEVGICWGDVQLVPLKRA
jgi:hypothetical protein